MDDYSFIHEASTSPSKGINTPNTNEHSNNRDVPSMIREPTDKESPDLNKLIELLVGMVAESHSKKGEVNTAQCIVDLARANERLSALVINGRKEIVRLRQECEALKANVNDDFKNLLVELKQDIVSLQQQALAIQPNPPKPRFCWNKSQSHRPWMKDCDVLDCQPLVLGNKYKWSVKVESTGENNIGVGVGWIFLGWFGFYSHHGPWAYHSHGESRHAHQPVQSDLPKYSAGSTLTFILDLTGNGTFSVYQDGDETNLIQLFNDMKSGMSESDGLLPIVSWPGRVEFLGFDDVE